VAGELWRSAFQIGKETTPGTGVAATRKMYFTTENSSLTGPARPATQHKFAVQRRSSQLAVTRGSIQPAGTVRMPLSNDESLELYAIGIQGGVTPATGVFTFIPGNTTPDAATLEWHDGANQWREAGVYANTLRWTGNVERANELEATLFGQTFVTNTLTAALTDRTPTFYEGWQSRVFIDALGATAGTTAVTGTLINWEVTFDNHLERKYFANNTQNLGALTIGEFDLSAQLTLEASSASALTEYTNAQSVTARLVQLKFGTNGTSTTLDIPGIWTAEDLGQRDKNTRVYRMTLQYIYDATNAFGFRVKSESTRTATFA
jgi:hypothetical protein